MQTLEKKINEIEHLVKQKDGKEVRVISEIEYWQAYRQGDVYVMLVPEDWKMENPTTNKQLVPGNNKGSRHMAEGVKLFSKWEIPEFLFKKAAKFFRLDRETLVRALMSRGIKSVKAWKNTHPEHADFHNPAGCYISWSQLDSRTLERVRD